MAGAPGPPFPPTLAGPRHRPRRGWQRPGVPWTLGSAAWPSQASHGARGRGKVLEGAGPEHWGGGLACHLLPQLWVQMRSPHWLCLTGLVWERLGGPGLTQAPTGPPPHPSRTRYSLRGRNLPEPPTTGRVSGSRDILHGG